MQVTCGNSFCNKANARPLEAMMTRCPLSKQALIMGMLRVACPNPQSRGATRMFRGAEFTTINVKLASLSLRIT